MGAGVTKWIVYVVDRTVPSEKSFRPSAVYLYVKSMLNGLPSDLEEKWTSSQ